MLEFQNKYFISDFRFSTSAVCSAYHSNVDLLFNYINVSIQIISSFYIL